MSTPELAWAAGFFDGEGSTVQTSRITNGRSSRRYSRIQMSLAQNDRRPLDRFAAAVGAGSICGPYQFRRRNPIYIWRASSKRDVLAVINALWLHLSEPKREQIERSVENHFNYQPRTGN